MSYIPGEMRSGKPKAAILVAGALLAGTLLLAALVVEGRGLGERVQPEGWPASLQPPRGWQVGDSARDDRVVFLDDPQDELSRQLAIHYLQDAEKLTARQICIGLAPMPRETDLYARVGPAEPCPIFVIEAPAFLGLWRGKAGIALMTAGVVPRPGAANDVFVLEMRFPGEIDLPDIRLLQAVAASVQLKE